MLLMLVALQQQGKKISIDPSYEDMRPMGLRLVALQAKEEKASEKENSIRSVWTGPRNRSIKERAHEEARENDNTCEREM